MPELNSLLKLVHPSRVTAVGDVVSRETLAAGIRVDLRILDRVSMRKPTLSLDLGARKTYHVKNPAGVITLEAWEMVKRAMKEENVVIVVEGEEDLLALPCIVESPDDAIVLYGQPSQGLVVVQSTPAAKKKAARILGRMTKEETDQSSSAVTLQSVLDEMKQKASPKAVEGMSRFGIQTTKAFGISVPQLRDLAKKVGTNHEIANQLWRTGVHEARILASMIDDPKLVTKGQMEKWVADFDSWDVVDGCCGNLFDKTPYAVSKAHEWSERGEEFVKRASFVLMAELAVHDKNASDKTFLQFLPLIVREASDERNFVKKAVNWALRQIGKRNGVLNVAAIRTANTIQDSDSRSAKWIAADALRELTSVPVRTKLGIKSSSSE
jgi:3-methyladenine DNA glycosylase AlkD/uncharacterized protein (UPF0218 family)